MNENEMNLNQDDNDIVPERPTREKCEVCNQAEHKYKCPNCSMKTCSLQCCKQHKIEKSCDGKYHYEKFIRASEMDEKLLRKDLTYLHDMLQESEKTKKKLSTLKTQEQLRFKLLKIYSQKLHDIKLKIAPQIMSKHRENLSFYHTKTKKIFWTIGLVFYVPSDVLKNKGMNADNYRWLTDPREESQTLMEIIDQENINDSNILILMKDKANSNKLLEIIKESTVNGFIKDESNPREKRMFRVDWWEPLSENIKQMTLIEYPVIHIVFKQDMPEFEKEFTIVTREKELKKQDA